MSGVDDDVGVVPLTSALDRAERRELGFPVGASSLAEVDDGDRNPHAITGPDSEGDPGSVRPATGATGGRSTSRGMFLADDPTPHGQPLTALPLITSLIDGELADAQEHQATLLSVRDRPYVLDDATVERTIKLHTEQRDFLGVFAEQLARWRHERPTDAQRCELDRLEGQLERLQAVLTNSLELAEELQQGTIERVLAKSDLELGIEALLPMTKGR